MNCPYCQSECAEGYVRAKYIRGFGDFGMTELWVPKEEEGKLFKKHLISLPVKTAAYYCENCRKVFAEFDANPRYR